MSDKLRREVDIKHDYITARRLNGVKIRQARAEWAEFMRATREKAWNDGHNTEGYFARGYDTGAPFPRNPHLKESR